MVEALIKLRRKVLSGFTSVAAWFKRPTRERRSLFVPVQRGVVCAQAFPDFKMPFPPPQN